MRTCVKCGGNAYVDADTLCEHEFFEVPEPTYVFGTFGVQRGEPGWAASGCIGDHTVRVDHPTREVAIALWQERALWGPAIAGLFGWLLEPPLYLGDMSPEQRREIADTLEKLGADWRTPVTGTFRPMSAFFESNDEAVRAIDDEIASASLPGPLIAALEQLRAREREAAEAAAVEARALEFMAALEAAEGGWRLISTAAADGGVQHFAARKVGADEYRLERGRSEVAMGATFTRAGFVAAIRRALEGRDPFVHEATDPAERERTLEDLRASMGLEPGAPLFIGDELVTSEPAPSPTMRQALDAAVRRCLARRAGAEYLKRHGLGYAVTREVTANCDVERGQVVTGDMIDVRADESRSVIVTSGSALADARRIVDSIDRNGGQVFALSAGSSEPWTISAAMAGGYTAERPGWVISMRDRDAFVSRLAGVLEREVLRGGSLRPGRSASLADRLVTDALTMLRRDGSAIVSCGDARWRIGRDEGGAVTATPVHGSRWSGYFVDEQEFARSFRAVLSDRLGGGHG